METKANYVLVGVFTLVAILAAFGFVYWTAGIGDRGEVATLRIRIPGSASGLGRGSFVMFNGVKVGDVTRVFIDVQNPKAAIADATIDRNTPLTKSTKAVIGIAGLTGQANVELNGGSLQEPNLLDEAANQGRIAEIDADPSAVTNLLQTAQDIFKRADTVITNLEGLTGDARGPLAQTAKNAETFSNALARNADGIDKFLSSVSQLSDEVSGIAPRVDRTLAAAQGLLEAVDKQKVQTIVSNAEAVSNDLRSAGTRVDAIAAKVDAVVAQADTIVRSFNDTAATVNQVAKQSQGTISKVETILDGVDPATVRSALSNIEQTSRSAVTAAANIRDLSGRATPILDNIGKVAEKFGNRAGEIDGLIADAGTLAGRLSAASGRVDGILQDAGGAIRKADDILSGVDRAKIASAVDNIEQTSRSANAAAANIRDLSARATPILDNVGKVAEKFGNRAEDIDLLIADAGALGGRLNAASETASKAIERANSILSGVDPQAVRNAVDNISQAASTANSAVTTFKDVAQTASNVANDVDRVTSSVSARTPQIDQFVADASQLAARLNAASVRVDGILQKTDNLLGSDATNGLVVQASETLAAYRRVADTLNARIGTIADNLSRFSGQGLSDVRNFVQDSQRAVTRIEGAVDDIQRNPQRIITGGDGEVRRYNGRARR